MWAGSRPVSRSQKGCGPGDDPSQTLANAQLIAAAPELLAALKTMIGFALVNEDHIKKTNITEMRLSKP